MSGLRLRRAIAAAAALTWPAIRLFETITHPWWGNALSDAVAPLVAMVLLALVITSPAAQRRHSEGGVAKGPAWLNHLVLAQLARLKLEMSGLDARVELCEIREDRAEAKIGRCEKRVERSEARLAGAIGQIDKANKVAGLSEPDGEDPPRLQIVRLSRRGCYALAPFVCFSSSRWRATPSARERGYRRMARRSSGVKMSTGSPPSYSTR